MLSWVRNIILQVNINLSGTFKQTKFNNCLLRCFLLDREEFVLLIWIVFCVYPFKLRKVKCLVLLTLIIVRLYFRWKAGSLTSLRHRKKLKGVYSKKNSGNRQQDQVDQVSGSCLRLSRGRIFGSVKQSRVDAISHIGWRFRLFPCQGFKDQVRQFGWGN